MSEMKKSHLTKKKAVVKLKNQLKNKIDGQSVAQLVEDAVKAGFRIPKILLDDGS